MEAFRENEYRAKSGNPTFMYKVVGCTPEQILNYKKFKGDKYRSTFEMVNGERVEYPLMWINDGLKDSFHVRQTINGNFVDADNAMLKLEGFMKSHKEFAGAIAQQIAAQVVSNLNLFGNSNSRNATNSANNSAINTEQPKVEEIPSDLDEM